MNFPLDFKDRFKPSSHLLISQADKCDTRLAVESAGSAGLKSLRNTRDRGAFFTVVIPKGLGPMHLTRLVLTLLVEGRIRDDIYILILFDLIERILRTAERDRKFRIKWRQELIALLHLTKSLNQVTKSFHSIQLVTYILRNRLGQKLNIEKFLIPPHNRKDEPVEQIKVLFHREYTPTPKKSTKVPSNSAGTKGSYQPDSISWKDVAQKSSIWEKGKWIKVFEEPTKNLEELNL